MAFKISIFVLALFVCIGLTGCYYDTEEELYPDSGVACDSTKFKYTTDIAPIMLDFCNVCHGESSPQAGINTSTWSGLQTIVSDGSLLGSVQHAGSYSPMPKSQAKLNACNISKIRKWIEAGAPNN